MITFRRRFKLGKKNKSLITGIDINGSRHAFRAADVRIISVRHTDKTTSYTEVVLSTDGGGDESVAVVKLCHDFDKVMDAWLLSMAGRVDSVLSIEDWEAPK